MGRIGAVVVGILLLTSVVWAECVCKEDMLELTSTPYQRCICDNDGVVTQAVYTQLVQVRSSVFVKWTGDFCHGSTNPVCTFTMPDKDVKINAQFNKKPMKPTWRRGM